MSLEQKISAPQSMQLPLVARVVSAVQKKPIKIALLRLLVCVIFFGGWELLAITEAVNPLFISSPSLIIQSLIKDFSSGSIWPHLVATGTVVGIGFLLSCVVGVPLGLLMGRSETLRSTLEPFTTALYAAPQVAFLPLLIIWLGIGVPTKVALVFLGSFIIVMINTETGVSQVDKRLVETARSFMASEFKILTRIVLPSALPYIVAGMRLAVGRALVMVVVAEIYASDRGIGYLIFQAGGFYDTAQVFVGVFLLAGTGIALNSLLRWVQAKLSPWQER